MQQLNTIINHVLSLCLEFCIKCQLIEFSHDETRKHIQRLTSLNRFLVFDVSFSSSNGQIRQIRPNQVWTIDGVAMRAWQLLNY